MMERLRLRIRGALSRLRPRSRRSKGPKNCVRGCARNVIVVRPPDKRFQEAVFILRQEAFRDGGVSCSELLEQARIAAEEETAAMLPPARRHLRPGLVFLLGFFAALLGLRLLGLL